MLEDIFGCHSGEVECYWHLVGEPRDIIKHPIVPRMDPYTETSALIRE